MSHEEKVDHLIENRGFLINLAYRMVGSRAEAEDLVQETFIRAQDLDWGTIAQPRAWLATVLTRLCLDHLKSARVQREHYVGPWLPEPVSTERHPELRGPVDASVLAESLSLAFLVVLERLSPLERAVFLLHEAFDYSHREIGEILERDEGAIRQLLRRAKQHVRDEKPRFALDRDVHRTMLERFIGSIASGRLEAIEALLVEQAVLRSDAGGKAKAALKPLFGPNKIARFLLGVLPHSPRDLQLDFVEVNGWPALRLRSAGRTTSVFTIQTDGERIWSIDIQMNPDKLTQLA